MKGKPSDIVDLMMAKQEQRALFWGKEIDHKDFIKRAQDAVVELASMNQYSTIIVNHDAEGSPNWMYNLSVNADSKYHDTFI